VEMFKCVMWRITPKFLLWAGILVHVHTWITSSLGLARVALDVAVLLQQPVLDTQLPFKRMPVSLSS
jgi:hypothetical protein